MTMTATLVLLVLATAPEAGTLAELDGVLARYSAHEPIRVRFEHRFEATNGDGGDTQRTRGEVSGEVSDGGAGLELKWPRALIDRLREEESRRSQDPDAETPTSDGVGELDAKDLARHLDAAAVLRQRIAGAKVREDREDVVDGAPARLLVLEIKPILSSRDRRYVKNVEASMRIWLGTDGVPIAAELASKVSGRAFLVISFKAEQRESYRFASAKGRLVAVRHQRWRRSEGAGEKGERQETTVLELERDEQ